MWWESIPSFSVIVAGMGILPMIIYGANRLELGNAYRRQILYHSDAHLFLRDERVSGTMNPYLQKGLENIPDEPPASTSEADAACKC